MRVAGGVGGRGRGGGGRTTKRSLMKRTWLIKVEGWNGAKERKEGKRAES